MKYPMKTFILLLIGIIIHCTIHPARAITYSYDQLHRLTKVTYDNGDAISYLFDQAGNITRIQRILTGADPDLDINNNGIVDLADALCVLRILTGLPIPAGENSVDWNLGQLKTNNGLAVTIRILNKIADTSPGQ